MKDSNESAKSRLHGETANVGAPSVEDQLNAIGVGPFHYMQIAILSLICMADGMEMVVLSLLGAPLEKEWGVSKLEIGFLSSATFLGSLVGSLAGGAMGDTYGRRNTILAGGLVFAVGGVASAFAPDLISLCLLRCIVGLGYGVLLPVAMCSFAELVPTDSRAFYNLLLGGVTWSIGEMVVCLIAIIVHRIYDSTGWWRLVLLASPIPGIIGLALAFFYTPESPQYLSVQGRHEEAEALLLDIATQNGCADKLLQGGRIRQVVLSPGRALDHPPSSTRRSDV